MAQGCSDAGFCSLKYGGTRLFKQNIHIGNVLGIADGNTFVNTIALSYSRSLQKGVYWDTKVTANYASGALGHNFNAGDIITNLAFPLISNKKHSAHFLAGMKIPLTNANDQFNGKVLPLAYQSSIGTWDLLFGLQYKINNWEITNAYQIPLTPENNNQFIKENSTSKDFVSSNKLERKSDILARIAYRYALNNKKLTFTPNLLAIFHTAKDRFTNTSGTKELIPGSEGLTLNASLLADYLLKNNQNIGFSFAIPFVVRTVRPDGLTRKFTLGIEYKISF